MENGETAWSGRQITYSLYCSHPIVLVRREPELRHDIRWLACLHCLDNANIGKINLSVNLAATREYLNTVNLRS
jgi:hypothetical protein